MLVILEGVDGSGKSTLASMLEDLGFSTVRVPRKANWNYFNWIEVRELALKTNIVLDRSWISDMVYTIENPKEHKPWPIELSEIGFLMRKTIVVHCDTDRALANAINRGEDNVNTKERHDRIRNLYNDIINMIKAYGSCEIVRYDYSDSKAYDNVYKFIKVRLNEDGV
jgi:thymidylate kinase